MAAVGKEKGWKEMRREAAVRKKQTEIFLLGVDCLDCAAGT